MNRKMLPLMFMLISGAITCVATWIHDYSILEKLVILLIVLLVFGSLGSLLQHTMDYFDKQNAKKLEEEQNEQEEDAQVQEKAAEKA